MDKHTNPPTYLSKMAVPTSGGGPSSLLIDGTWCGHGEPLFGVYDIRTTNAALFFVQLPSGPAYPELPAVTVASPTQEAFFVYDPRKHPASLFANIEGEFPLKPSAPFACPSCGCQSFALAVGFEIPSDSSGPDDVSWFALAAECSKCKWHGIIFDDETA